MLNPPTDLWNLMSRVKMCTQLEDDVRQAKKAAGITFQGEGAFKKRKKSSVDYESWVRQRINMAFKEPIYKLLSQIRDKPYFKKPKPMGEDPKKFNKVEVFFPQRKMKQNKKMKVLLDQLVRDWHLKEFVDKEKTRVEKAEAKPNTIFD